MQYYYLQCSEEETNLSTFKGLFLFTVLEIRTGNQIQLFYILASITFDFFYHKCEEQSLEEFHFIAFQLHFTAVH